MNIQKVKKIVYRYIVDNNPLVSQSFQNYLEYSQLEQHYMKKGLKLLELNWKYRICRKSSLDEKLSKLSMPEYKVTSRNRVEEVSDKLNKFDVISFDVFDTLIFRAVDKPRDVFRLLEAQWNIMGFAKVRQEAERKAREKDPEASIYDIYDILEKEFAIKKEEGIEQEIEVEKKVCYANPYMKQVFDRVKKEGKIIVATSDMYFPKEIMKEILLVCGYDGFHEIYVSCDAKVSKRCGSLQKIVQEKEGKAKSYIHVGDNKETDIIGSRQVGWETVYYENIGKIGTPYRRTEMKSLASSFYKGLVNAKLHSGIYGENEFYEYGYVYGGSMAVGYCQFLKKLAQMKKIDQFLFVARDGYIIHKIYQEYDKDMACAYVPFSRFASYQLTMERSWKEFLKHTVMPRVNVEPRESLKEVIKICDMSYIRPYLQNYGLTENDAFDYAAYKKVYTLFAEHIEEIEQTFSNTVLAAKKYFQNVIGDNKNICIVDVGWQGTGAVCLKYFLEKKCNMNINVCGALMGTANTESTDLYLSNEVLYSYMFSTQKNRDTMLKHTGKRSEWDFRNLLVEILFTEDKPSFLKYQLSNSEEIEFVYGIKENNAKIVESVQKGIYDFSMDYFTYEKKIGKVLVIPGREAYMPIDSLTENKRYCLKLLGQYEINGNPGIFDEEHYSTLEQVVNGNR